MPPHEIDIYSPDEKKKTRNKNHTPIESLLHHENPVRFYAVVVGSVHSSYGARPNVLGPLPLRH